MRGYDGLDVEFGWWKSGICIEICGKISGNGRLTDTNAIFIY
jgi:hypothetical protein